MRLHRHAGFLGETEEARIAAELTVKPLFDRLSALLGQIAGILLLAGAGGDPESERLHVFALRAQFSAAIDAVQRVIPPPGLDASYEATRRALPILSEILADLEKRRAADATVLRRHIGRVLEVRRLLLAASVPALGVGLVDLTGACCAPITIPTRR
jgi:hypothetical protein